VDQISNGAADMPTYEAPKVLASFDADDIFAEAETSSVIIIVS
jgi:hypothetical protein